MIMVLSKSLFFAAKGHLLSEDIDSSGEEVKSYTVHFELSNTSIDGELDTETVMVNCQNGDLFGEFKDDIATKEKDSLPSDAEGFVQESSLSSDHVATKESKEADQKQDEVSVIDNSAHKKDDLEADAHQERVDPEAFNEQEVDVSSSDHATNAERPDKQLVAGKNRTDEQNNKRLAVFALLSLLLVYLYISTCL